MKISLVPFALLSLAAGSFALVSDPVSTTSLSSAIVPSNFVSVSTSGTVFVYPTYLSLKATLSSTASVAEQAVVDFNQAQTRALGGLESTLLPNLVIKNSGIEIEYGPPQDMGVGNMAGVVIMGGGMSAPATEEGVTCSTTLNAQFSPKGDLAAQQIQVAQALDMAIELGLEVKSSASSQFSPFSGTYNDSPTDSGEAISGVLSAEAKSAAQAAAQADAMQQAHEMAASLAALSGRELGIVISVQQTEVNSSWNGLGAGVEVSAELTVTFNLK